jgi:hypothetical protein
MHNRIKKLIALFLLSTLLLNSGGELAIHQYLVYRSNQFFNKQTNRGLYNVQDLTEVKLNVSTPGITDWTSYQKMYGEVRFAHATYNYVKMKITRDAIYLLCVPDYETTHLCGENVIHAENINDIPVPPKQHVPYSKMSMLGDFNFVFNRFEFTVPVKTTPAAPAHFTDEQLNCHLDIDQPPPKAIFLS